MTEGKSDGELEAMVASVNKNMEALEDELGDTKDALQVIVQALADLPDEYIPRPEAEKTTDKAKKWISGLLFGGVIVAGSGIIGWNVNSDAAAESRRLAERSLANCEDTRMGFRQVIEIAVSDPARREMLLAVDGTKPELCR